MLTGAARHVLLLSNCPLEKARPWTQLALGSLERAGASVRVLPCDITDTHAVAAALSAVTPAVQGIVHLAHR